MTEHDEALDRFLDSLMQGSNLQESHLDPGSADAARRLVRAGSGPLPGPAFVNQLESLLVERSKPDATTGAPSRNAGIGIALRAREPRWRPHPILATAAILALVLGSMFSVLRLGDSSDGGNATIAGVFQAASASAHSDLTGTPESTVFVTNGPLENFYPAPSECPRLDPAMAATARAEIAEISGNYPPLLYSIIPGSTRPAVTPPHTTVSVFSQLDLPTGSEPSESDRRGIESSLRSEVACRNAIASSATADATPAIGLIAVPEILSMTQLADGRIGVLISSDLYGAGFQSYLVFLPNDGDWLLESFGYVAQDDWIMQSYSGRLRDSIQIDLYDVYFSPPELDVPANQAVTVTVTNHGDMPHTFTIERLNISLTLQPGQSETLNAQRRCWELSLPDRSAEQR